MALSSRLDREARRFYEFWADEMAAATMYRGIADVCEDEQREVFLSLAETEERHAAHWERILHDRGVERLPRLKLPLRARWLPRLARWFGVQAVLPIVLRGEAEDADKYRRVPEAPDSMAAQEQAHGRALAGLGGGGVSERIARSEGRHRTGAGNALRASVFGVNDGLVSNLALVMGVAGGTDGGDVVLLAGVAGLLAGAFSMGAGEWVSVRSQRELYEREIRVEAAELEAFPEEEREELVLIYRAKGIPADEARILADQIMSRPDTALDTMVREELGLDPSDLGSSWVAAFSSFFAFALGALMPVAPYFFAEGSAAFGAAAGLAGLALAAVGAATSIFTGRSALRAAVRMILIGAAAAAVTYLVGSAIGVTID